VGAGALSALLLFSFVHIAGAQSAPPAAVKTLDVPVAAVVKTPDAPAAAAATPVAKPVAAAMSGLPALLNFTAWNNSLMTVNLLMDGKIQRCVVDTGLSASTITPELAATLKLAALPSKITVASLNETRTVPETELKALKFNLLTITGLHAGIVDASELYLGSAQPDAPGLWLGIPFLSAYQVTFDFTAHTILLERPDARLPKGKGAVVLPIEVRDGQIFTRVSIPKAGTFSALIDTGAMGTLIPSAIAAKLKGVPTKTFDIKRPGGKQVKACLVMLPKMQAGRLEQEQVPALYFQKEADAPANADHTLAVLGHDFLRHYKVTLNFTRNKMVLIPPPLPNEGDGNVANANNNKRSGNGPNGSNGQSSSSNGVPSISAAPKTRTQAHF
jgi:predicted aspartyl protease